MVRTRILFTLVLGMVALMLPMTGPGAQEAEVVVPAGRVADSPDPTLASIAMSQAVFAAGEAEGAILARDEVFADSLAGASLAGTTRPILYTTGGADAELRPEVLTEIQRAVGSAQGCQASPEGEVFLLGGPAAISASAEQAIADAGYCLRRFAGASRVETSVLIAEAVVERTAFAQATSAQVLVSRDDDFADAATGGAYAALTGVPLVVTSTTDLHPAVADLLDQQGFEEAVLLGGEAALTSQVAEEIGARVDQVTRRAGASRDLTAIDIATNLWPQDQVRGALLVNGFVEDGFVHAIAGAVLAAVSGAPQLNTQGTVLPTSTGRYLAGTAGGFAGEDDEEEDVTCAGPSTAISHPTCALAISLVREDTTHVVAWSSNVGGTGIGNLYLADAETGQGLTTVATGEVTGSGAWHGTSYYYPAFDPDDGSSGVKELDLGPMVSVPITSTVPAQPMSSYVFSSTATLSEEVYLDAQPSPDGRQLATLTLTGAGDPSTTQAVVDIHDLQTGQRQARAVHPEGGDVVLPGHQSWWFDGSGLLLGEQGDEQLYFYDLGTGQLQPLVQGRFAAADPTAPTMVVRAQDGNTRWYEFDAPSGDPVILATFDFGEPALPIYSLDGREFYLTDAGDNTVKGISTLTGMVSRVMTAPSTVAPPVGFGGSSAAASHLAGLYALTSQLGIQGFFDDEFNQVERRWQQDNPPDETYYGPQTAPSPMVYLPIIMRQ